MSVSLKIVIDRKIDNQSTKNKLNNSTLLYFQINRHFSRKKNRSEKRVTLMIGLMISTFLLAWTPYATFALIEQFSSMEITPKMEVIPAVLAKSSIVYNPIIYVTLNKQLLAALFNNKSTARHNMIRDREPTAVTVT